MELYADSCAEAMSYFPRHTDYPLAPDQYLKQIARIKEIVSIPVIGSLNGATTGGWLKYAQLIEQAGADALELNAYFMATDPAENGTEIEQRVLAIAREVVQSVKIPVAIKISPFYSALSNFAARLSEAGAHGLVLFNRFYQPDIDVETLEVKPTLQLSDSSELLLRLRWTAILSSQINGDIAVSGGVHTVTDVIKSIMAGAKVTQLVSALLRKGPAHLAVLEAELKQWMSENSYSSIREMRGSMACSRCPDPQAFERANYLRALHSFIVR
jgi:dihydroorotate dehydrogenase (fumarate)